MHFLIRTPSSQLQLWYFLIDNLAENLDLLHVIDLFLISSKCHRSGACRIVGISVYVNFKSGLAHRNVCPDKENIVNTSPLCSVCTKIMIHKKAIMLFVLLLILTSLLDETAAPVRKLNHLQSIASRPRPGLFPHERLTQGLPHVTGELTGRTKHVEDAAPPVVHKQICRSS